MEHPQAPPEPSTRPWTEVRSVGELEALVGLPTPAARDKARAALSELDVRWLEASPFCVLATSSGSGECDTSPKGDPVGHLAHVVDERTVAIAVRPGNRRVDGYRNVLENPHVGLLFLIPGRGDTLRVNGRARLVSDAPFFADLEVRGHRPLLALVVDVEEVFHHCSKAFLRSGIWEPGSWDPQGVVPRRAVIAQAHERPGESLAELDAYYGPEYGRDLYG